VAGARLTLATAALLLSGCGVDVTPLGDAPSPTPGDTESATESTPDPSPSATGSAAPGSTPVVRRAVRDLFAAGTGRVTTTLTAGGYRVTDEARYDLARGFTFERQLLSPEGTLSLEGVVLGNDLWYRLLEPRETRCYVHTTPDALAGFTTREAAWAPTTQAPRPLVPTGLNVVSTFKGSGEPDVSGNHPGTTRLTLVVEILGAPALEASGLTRADRTRVGSRVRIVDGRLVTVVVDGLSLEKAFDEADADLPGADAATMQALISFSLEGDPVEVVAPDPALVVDLTTDQEQFEQDLRACEQAQR
jgi:hypothetical protein